MPPGRAYVELVTVVDPVEAATSVFGRWVAAAPPGPLGWAVRTRDLGGVAARLDLTVSDGSRVLPDGGVLRWQVAGVERAAADPPLPFFIAWDGPSPGHAAVTHPVGVVELAQLDLRGDADALAEWLGNATLLFVIGDGHPGVARVVLRAAGRRTIVLDAKALED